VFMSCKVLLTEENRIDPTLAYLAKFYFAY